MQVKKPQTKIEHVEVGLVEVKLAGDAEGTFSGYGAVFNNLDSYGDTIAPGAFANTLKEWNRRGKFPPMLLQHGAMGLSAQDMLPVGEWLSMEEDAKGLKVTGRLLALNTEFGQRVNEALKAGVLDGLSIGFEVIEAIYGSKPTEPARTLTDIKLWELSIVTFPANPKARVTGVKDFTPDELRQCEAILRDEGFSQRDAVMVMSGLKVLSQRDVGMPSNTPRDEVVSEDVAEILRLLDCDTAKTLRVVLD